MGGFAGIAGRGLQSSVHKPAAALPTTVPMQIIRTIAKDGERVQRENALLVPYYKGILRLMAKGW